MCTNSARAALYAMHLQLWVDRKISPIALVRDERDGVRTKFFCDTSQPLLLRSIVAACII